MRDIREHINPLEKFFGLNSEWLVNEQDQHQSKLN